jgi:SNF2 family DNA or RNA helicase
MEDTERLKFIPRPIQLPMLQHLWSAPRVGLWASMGSGKTSAALDFICKHKLINDVDPAWIVGPINVIRDTWPKEIDRFSDFADLTYSVVSGTAKERLAALAAKADVYLVNYDVIQWLWDVYFAKNPSARISILIGDEATRLRGFRLRQCRVQAKYFYYMSRIAGRVIELTGTPAPKGLRDLWGQLFILDAGVRLGKTMDAYTSRWFKVIERYGYRAVEPLPNACDEITARVKDICRTIRTEDYYDLDAVVSEDIRVDLPSHLTDMYREAERDMLIKLNDKNVKITNSADLTNKCLQIANGALYYNKDAHTTDNKYEELHTRKIEALNSILEDSNGENILVVYHYTFERKRLLDAFGKNVTVYDSHDAAGKIATWNAGKIRMFAVNAASVGHGLNLQWGGRIIVFFNNWWNMEQREQVIQRIGPLRQKQAGFNRSVLQYNIITRNTVDERVLLLHKLKCSVNDAILEGAL